MERLFTYESNVRLLGFAEMMALFPQALEKRPDRQLYDGPARPYFPANEPGHVYSPDYSVKTRFNPETGQYHCVRQLLGVFNESVLAADRSKIAALYESNPFGLDSQKRFGFAWSRYLYDVSVDFALQYPRMLPGYFEVMRLSGANGMMTLADAGSSYFREELKGEEDSVTTESMTSAVDDYLSSFFHQRRYRDFIRDKSGVRKYEIYCLGRGTAADGMRISGQSALAAGPEIAADAYETFNEYSQIHIVRVLELLLAAGVESSDKSDETLLGVYTAKLASEGTAAASILADKHAFADHVVARRKDPNWSVAGQQNAELVHLSSLARYGV